MTLRAFCALARFSMIACVTIPSLRLCMLLSVFSFSIPKRDCPAAEGTIILQIYLLRLEKFSYVCEEKRECIYPPLPSWSDSLLLSPPHIVFRKCHPLPGQRVPGHSEARPNPSCPCLSVNLSLHPHLQPGYTCYC